MHKLLLCDLFVLANPVPFSFRKSFLSAANVNVLAVNLEMPRLHLLVLWKRNWQPHVCDVAVREKRKVYLLGWREMVLNFALSLKRCALHDAKSV